MNQITEKEREFIENKLKMTTRTIVVSRTKQFCLNKIGCEIIFDGRKIASVDSGKKVDIKINGLLHKIACLWTFADGNQTLTETFKRIESNNNTSCHFDGRYQIKRGK